MATIKAVIRSTKSTGFLSVYIRVVHNSKTSYIKTGKMISRDSVGKSGEITDPVVNEFCSRKILQYHEILNKVNVERWSVQQVVEYLTAENEDVCFSDYARQHIRGLINNGQERNARNYKAALGHLERYFGTTKVMFSQLTSHSVSLWIKTLEKTARAKEQYPVCMRQVFKAAMLEYNDYDSGIIRIKTNPWVKVEIPQADRTTKRAISAEACREFFSAALPQSKMADPLPELGRDVAKLILCLAGINTIDIFELKKEDFRHGCICYKRAKTRNSRRDEAYIEMRVEPVLFPLFEKYQAPADDPYLFNFHLRYSTADSFNANVNNGIKKVCAALGMPKEKWYCAYTFRHTWATIAQNDCGAHIAEVGFAMNHSHGHTVTRTYLKVDFTPAWELNAKVVDFVLFSNKKSKQGMADDIDNPIAKQFKLSPKRMTCGQAFFKGEVLADITDIGFSNVDQVIAKLVPQLPDTIPVGSEVTFRIKDLDTGLQGVYYHTKGKGF